MNRIWKLMRRLMEGLGGTPEPSLTSCHGGYACCPAPIYSEEKIQYEVMLTRFVR